MEPETSTWYADYRGILMFKSVTGDFIATTRVRTTNLAGTGAPSSAYSLAGIMIRNPRAITASTWTAGGEDYIFLSLGRASGSSGFETEVKTTNDSNSMLEVDVSAVGELELRSARVGEYVIVLLRPVGGDWVVHRRYARADFAETMQVGMVTYTDWGRVSQQTASVYNNWSSPPLDGNPDLRASFDYFRFATPQPPAQWAALDLSDPGAVSDGELLAVLGD